jgi:hypothetical protein
MRLLYAAWLLCVQGRELDEDEVEPPVPPGLGDLSGPLRSLADFLRLDQDLLAAAAEASATQPAKAPSAAALTRWVKGLPEADKDAVVVRVLRRDDAHLRSEPLRRYDGRSAPAAAGGGRTVGELLASAQARWATRQRLAEERKAAERARREMVAAAAREQRLNALAAEQDQAWRRVAAMIETKKPREYDAAVELLAEEISRRNRARLCPSRPECAGGLPARSGGPRSAQHPEVGRLRRRSSTFNPTVDRSADGDLTLVSTNGLKDQSR